MFQRLRKALARPDTPRAQGRRLPDWALPLFVSNLNPDRLTSDGDVLVWAIEGDATGATISDQFKANAGDYHRRYSASDHFEALFRQAILATEITLAPQPLILDLGSGSGVNSIIPCRRLFPGARAIATDLSGELLEILALYLREEGAADEVVCVKMDAMSSHIAPQKLDLVTGASILHHLERPEEGLAAAARALRSGGRALFFEPFHGWAFIRLAFDRILAESALRGEPLDPDVAFHVAKMTGDIAARSWPDRNSPSFALMDDKWLFSRTQIEKMARAVGFSEVSFVPHNDHKTLIRDAAMVQIRLSSGRSDLALPDWAVGILDDFDAALTLHAKRELMLEATIVLTKGARSQ